MNMNAAPSLSDLISAFQASLEMQNFIKLTLGAYKGSEKDLKQIIARRVSIKRADKISFTYRYKTRDIVKNYDDVQAIELITEYLQEGFGRAELLTAANDFVLENGKLKVKPPSSTDIPDPSHNRAKNRLVETENRPYLHDLKITDDKGQVYKNAQDKFRQIDKYIEILSGLIKSLPQNDDLKIVDMGSGKGYLTFALYDYLRAQKIKAHVTGVEYRQDMVDLCNGIAVKNGFSRLSFSQGTIDGYDTTGANILIALHACDTATDDAIAKGIAAEADLIVVAPCCHKQIRREMEKNKHANDQNFLLKYGTFLERQAEMVTDGLRALILEYCGYSTKVFEFVSDAHTPKNVLIVATRTDKHPARSPDLLDKIKAAKSAYGIGQHYLEKVIGV